MATMIRPAILIGFILWVTNDAEPPYQRGTFDSYDDCFAAFGGSGTTGPISFAALVNSRCPYLTSLPKGSSPTVLMSGGVHRVRSITIVSARDV